MNCAARPSLIAILCAACAAPVMAAERYPERPIRLIAPYPPGGGVDLNARILAELLGPVLGQTILVDNRQVRSAVPIPVDTGDAPAEVFTVKVGAGAPRDF